MANGTSGIGSTPSIYPSLPQAVGPQAPANAAAATSPDQQLQALVTAAQGGDASALQTLNQLQSSGALDAYMKSAQGAGGTAPVGATDSFSGPSAPAAPTVPGATASDPYGLLAPNAGDPVLNDGTVDPAASAKAKSGGAFSDLSHFLVLDGAYKNWKVSKGLLAGEPTNNAWTRELKTAQMVAPGGRAAVAGEVLANGAKAKAGQYVVETSQGLIAPKNGIFSRFGRAGALAERLDTRSSALTAARDAALKGEALPADASRLGRTLYKLNSNGVVRRTTAFTQSGLARLDTRLTNRAQKGIDRTADIAKAKTDVAAAKGAKDAAGVAEAKTALKAAKKSGGFFSRIGGALSHIPGVKQVGGFFARHSTGLRRMAFVGAVINGVIDAKKALDNVFDPNASLAKKFFSVTAVAGDVVGASKVPGVAQLVGDGVAYASSYGRDHS